MSNSQWHQDQAAGELAMRAGWYAVHGIERDEHFADIAARRLSEVAKRTVVG